MAGSKNMSHSKCVFKYALRVNYVYVGTSEVVHFVGY